MTENIFSKGIRFQCQGSSNCCVSRGSYGFVYLSKKDILKLNSVNKLNTYDDKYHVYDHEFGKYISTEKQRKRRGIFYALVVGIVFIASHYMAINYVEDEGSAGFYPPYVEKRVVYPELYKEK